MIVIEKEKRLTIRVSEKMLKEFNEALKKTEHSKSEILRECIREFVKKCEECHKDKFGLFS